jgi:ubiquinone/menaquinone biosynthesis C-methylase UbiE
MEIERAQVLQPGGVELTLEAESYLQIRPADRILSIGCGNGELECYLARKYGCAIEGIDLDADVIRQGAENAAKQGIANVSFAVGDSRRTQYADRTFDILFCGGGLTTNLEIDRVILTEGRRVLKRDGKAAVILSMWSEEAVPDEAAALWGRAQFLRPSQLNPFFRDVGFQVLARVVHREEALWENWLADMIRLSGEPSAPTQDAAMWEGMRRQYRDAKKYLGVGLLILRT